MVGLRYHVASLAAVFVALAVGILLGVAISGRVSDASEGLEEADLRDDNARLQQEAESARAEAEAALRRGEASSELIARAYPALMEDRLLDQHVAVLFLGPADGSLRAEIEGALADADGGAPSSVVALDVPLDGADLHAALEGDELLAAYAEGEDDFSDLGRELGRELSTGTETPLWDALSTRLVEERLGVLTQPADSAVVVLTWQPPEGGEDGPETRATASLLEGIVSGLDSTGIPVVGVAAAGDPPERVEFYRDQGLSSVDDVDSPAGRLALALLLAGAEPGHYGIGEQASDGVVPPVEPLPDDAGE
ncbi:MAG TPA: copper transporter [Gaiellaceae bacterium]|nr:copper transporter [Gaiellaceae bacterium]